MTGLIEKLENGSPRGTFTDPEHVGYVAGYKDAFDIVRQHEAEQPPELVARAFNAAWEALHNDKLFIDENRNEFIGRNNSTKSAWIDVAVRAALASLGDGSATSSLIAVEVVTKPAKDVSLFFRLGQTLFDLGDGIATTATGAAETVPQPTPASVYCPKCGASPVFVTDKGQTNRICRQEHEWRKGEGLPFMGDASTRKDEGNRICEPRSQAALSPATNEQFKRLCKLGTPINTLIGATRSVKGLDKMYGLRTEWVDSLLDHAEKAAEAWDGIVELFEGKP